MIVVRGLCLANTRHAFLLQHTELLEEFIFA